jgi:transcriptional regulator with XRE-family HTH domain
MNTVMIGNTILRLRKEKNLTQEQLANMIGISAGAICKWETGNSVPDISLLAPLARTLGTSTDALLSFTSELSHDDVHSLKQDLTSTFTEFGYEVGEEKCKELLYEYPNCTYLKLAIAEVIQLYAMMYADESEKNYKTRLEYVISLLDAVIDSKDPKYISQGLFHIAGIHMLLENYDKGEIAVKQLSENFIDPMPLYPAILQKQGKTNEAKLLCENMLLARLTQITAMLSIMAKISLTEDNWEQAFEFINAEQVIQQKFNIGLYTSDYNLCKLYIKSNQLELAAETFKLYVEKVISADYDYRNNIFFKDVKLEVGEIIQKCFRVKMYQSFIDNSELIIMKGLPDYEIAIKLLKSKIA